MKTLKYTLETEVPIEKLWEAITDAEMQKIWLKAFSSGSYMKGKWGLGEYVYFLDPDMGGTKAEVIEFTKNKKIKVQHVAMISKNGVEETSGEMTEKWIGTFESYDFAETEKGSRLDITMQTHPDFAGMSEDSWPKALEIMKDLIQK